MQDHPENMRPCVDGSFGKRISVFEKAEVKSVEAMLESAAHNKPSHLVR